MSFSDLWGRYVRSLDGESDRGCALVGADHLSRVLRAAIEVRLSDLSRSRAERLLEGHHAPLGTFSSRILIARGLGILDENQYQGIDKVRDIRNAFAHSIEPIPVPENLLAEAVRYTASSGSVEHDWWDKAAAVMTTPRAKLILVVAAHWAYLTGWVEGYRDGLCKGAADATPSPNPDTPGPLPPSP